jgi:hypothetical protein
MKAFFLFSIEGYGGFFGGITLQNKSKNGQ